MTNDDAQLHERDWQFMLDSIYRINTTSSVEKLQYETLSCLRSLTPSYQGTFSMIKMEHGIARSSRPVIVGAPAHLIEKFTDNYDEDPYYDGLYLKTASYAFRDRDMIPEDVRESSPVWNEIYKPEGLTYALRALLSHDNAVIGEIALFNTKAESEFTNRDVRIANLMHHISPSSLQVCSRKNAGARALPARRASSSKPVSLFASVRSSSMCLTGTPNSKSLRSSTYHFRP